MYDHILLPVDLSHPDANDKAMRTARQIARDYDAVLHVLSVVPPIEAFAASFFPDGHVKDMTEAALELLHAYTREADLEGVNTQHVVAHGSIYDQILSIAGTVKADLIVMASHRPELSDYLLGPTAARVVRHAHCSVMVVRK